MYDHLTTEQLNDLIYELSLKSKLDCIAKINEKAPESLSKAILAPKE